MNNFIRKSFISSFILLSIFTSSAKPEKKVLKVGAIPDQNQEILDRRFNALSKELANQLNVKVKYVPVINYVAPVTAAT